MKPPSIMARWQFSWWKQQRRPKVIDLSKAYAGDKANGEVSRSSVITDLHPLRLTPQVQARVEKNKCKAKRRKESFLER